MAYTVMVLYSYGPILVWPYMVMALYSYGLHRDGMYRWGDERRSGGGGLRGTPDSGYMYGPIQ